MSKQIDNEVLFNAVEAELVRRHAVGETPDAFAGKSVTGVRGVIKNCWQLYHESQSIIREENRLVWQRDALLPAQALDTTKLVNSLKHIWELIDLTAIGQYRMPTYCEESSVALLDLITKFYVKLRS